MLLIPLYTVKIHVNIMIISIEFSTELNINKLNENIIKIIDDKGLDVQC